MQVDRHGRGVWGLGGVMHVSRCFFLLSLSRRFWNQEYEARRPEHDGGWRLVGHGKNHRLSGVLLRRLTVRRDRRVR